MAKYLPSLGWEVEVLTVPEDHAWSPDPTLLTELPAGLPVHRIARMLTGVVDPASGAARAAGEPHQGWRRRMAEAIILPDPGLLWALPALHAARRLAHQFDVVLTSAPPFSTHLVGLGLAGRLPWVADYRDNWTTNPDFQRGAVIDTLNRFLERRVLHRAAAVTVVSEAARLELLSIRPGLVDRIRIAMNGFDPDDLPQAEADRELFRVVHAGSMRQHRDPAPLIQALAAAGREDPELGTRLRLELIGRIPASVVSQAQMLLGERATAPGFLVHREALRRSAVAAVLVVLSSRAEAGDAALTSKLFECLALRRPVLFIGPAGPGADLVKELGAGEVVEPDDEAGLSTAVQRLFVAWRGGRERVATTAALQPFTRMAAAEAVAAALDLAVNQRRS